MHGTIQFNSNITLDVRIIGKKNLVIQIYKDGKHICQVNLRKNVQNKFKWSCKVKKIAKGYTYEGGNNWKIANDDLLIKKIDDFLIDYYMEKELLT